MSRPSWNSIFINICKIISTRSTCARLQTGCVIVKDTNIVSMGYNGVPSEKKHCIDYWKETRGDNYAETSNFLVDHHEWSLINELHAEMNAILQSEVSLKGTSLYTLYSPCIQCAKCIVSAKIKNVYYLYKYERDYEYTKTLLQKSEIGLCEVII